ncbi:MAG: Fe2+-dependent dioxygenase [Pseudomonadota bacterium]
MFAGLTGVLGRAQIEEVFALLSKAEFQDGKQTAGYRASRVKSNLQLRKGTQEAARLSDIISTGLTDNTAFRQLTFPKAINTPLFARYLPGMEYGYHVDNAVMNQPHSMRTDISCTVFLNNPDDYEGGELSVITPYGQQQAKLQAGDAIVYNANLVHRVQPVTKGERLVAVTWIQSFIKDPDKREVLIDLRQMQNALHKHAPDDATTDLAYKTYQNLYRMWADV